MPLSNRKLDTAIVALANNASCIGCIAGARPWKFVSRR